MKVAKVMITVGVVCAALVLVGSQVDKDWKNHRPVITEGQREPGDRLLYDRVFRHSSNGNVFKVNVTYPEVGGTVDGVLTMWRLTNYLDYFQATIHTGGARYTCIGILLESKPDTALNYRIEVFGKLEHNADYKKYLLNNK